MILIFDQRLFVLKTHDSAFFFFNHFIYGIRLFFNDNLIKEYFSLKVSGNKLANLLSQPILFFLNAYLCDVSVWFAKNIAF